MASEKAVCLSRLNNHGDLDIGRGNCTLDSGKGKLGLCKTIGIEVQSSDEANPVMSDKVETPTDRNLRNSKVIFKKNPVKVDDYDEVSNSSDDENNNPEAEEMPTGYCTKRSVWDDDDMVGDSKKLKC